MLIYLNANDQDYVVRVARFASGGLDVELQSLGITRIPFDLKMLHDLCYPMPSPLRLHLSLSAFQKLELFRTMLAIRVRAPTNQTQSMQIILKPDSPSLEGSDALAVCRPQPPLLRSKK
ncbi:hypothetical protein B0H13DRAFT_2345318 [Mycena leptocephala]|nr:hypothetical protein B0H13DRAFT_2345318 [Mycena leptocephala]